MKKIVVITSSPRKKGNSFKMTDAFIKGAAENGNEILRFDTAFMNLKGCIACNKCFQNGRPCIAKDDFSEIGEAILAADTIVFTTPVYWYTFPAQIKNVIDKLYSFLVGEDVPYENKDVALISCCEENDMSTFDGVKFSFEKTIALLKWKNIGEILVPGAFNIGDIDKTDGIEQAYNFGKSIS
jgi:multimeric flavodoxin WrbA